MTFVCVRGGVYLNDVVGPFATSKDAVVECQRLADEEPDTYHIWYVASLGKNGLTRIDDTAYSLAGTAKTEDWYSYVLPYTKRTP